MPNNRDTKGGCNPWGRLRPVQQNTLESIGLPSKGDTRLLDFKAQETFYSKIVDRYMTFCSDAGHGAGLLRRFSSLSLANSPSDHMPSMTNPSGTNRTAGGMPVISVERLDDSHGLSDMLSALRKLREGIVASKRADDFAAQAYLFCVRISILAKQPESYHPAILHLLRNIHQQHPLTPSEAEEVAGYLVLDTACRRKQLAEAMSIQRKYNLKTAEIKAALYSVIHDNYIVFRRTQQAVDAYRARLMEWADGDMRMHTLKCLGRTYHSVSLAFLENVTASRWADLVHNDGVGWELDEQMVTIRKIKGR